MIMRGAGRSPAREKKIGRTRPCGRRRISNETEGALAHRVAAVEQDVVAGIWVARIHVESELGLERRRGIPARKLHRGVPLRGGASFSFAASPWTEKKGRCSIIGLSNTDLTPI